MFLDIRGYFAQQCSRYQKLSIFELKALSDLINALCGNSQVTLCVDCYYFEDGWIQFYLEGTRCHNDVALTSTRPNGVAG